jgi:hypothetical protein
MREASHQQLSFRMEACASDMGVVLVKVETLSDAPCQVGVIVFIGTFWRVIPQHIFPNEQCAVLADCVNRFLIGTEPSTD